MALFTRFIYFLLFISPIYSAAAVEEEYEIFTQPMVSEGVQPGNQTMFEMEEDHERLCGVEGRLLKEKGNMLVQCSSDAECLPPSSCHPETGFCCMIALHQEPPPVGCPIGTRSLRNASGVELTCNPSNPNSCPGGALCYTDSLTQEKRCCGSDPGMGCPAGSKAITFGLQETPLLCTPGRIACPNGALCQWSHLIDRYQCCQPDNGCPRHQAPLKTPNGDPLPCTPGGTPCPGGAGCRFNFWTASHQCCRTDTADLCPAGQVPSLNTDDASPMNCNNDSDCPFGYLCGDNKLCCGEPGTCPRGNSAFKDAYGRITACSSRQGNTCPAGSTCMDSSLATQRLCCTQEDYVCPGFATPVPSAQNPLTCTIGQPNTCPDGICMPSNFKGVSICCRSTISTPPPIHVVVPPSLPVNPCPPGWNPQDNRITYCLPAAQTSTCPGFSSCIRSATVAQQFVCCVPVRRSRSNERCERAGAQPEILNGVARKCSAGRHEQCSQGFTCQPAIKNGWLCCSSPRAQAQTSLACPLNSQSPVIVGGGQNLFCNTPGGRGDCPENSLCVVAAGTANSLICCRSTTSPSTPVCPNNGIPQLAINGYVNCAGNPAICATGYSCVTSVDQSAQMCCSFGGNTPQPVCPNQQRLYLNGGVPRNCLTSQPSACPPGYSCQQAISTPFPFVCCSVQTATSVCPPSFTPHLNPQGENIYCTIGNANGCPPASICLADANNVGSPLCCRVAVADRICPAGLNALLTSTGQVQTCSGPGNPCPRAGYSCHFYAGSTSSGYVCCGNEQTVAVCADGRETFVQTTGSTYTCNPFSTNTGCPIGYDCSASTQAGVSVCCKTFTVPTTTPTPFLQCPNGWNPFRNAVTQQVQFCSSTTDQSCPVGYSCTPSSQPSSYLCCRLASTMSCPFGQTLLANGQPRLCSRNLPNQCPRGYTCETSTNPSVSICCSSFADESVLCPDRSQPAKIGPNARHCPALNSNAGCPAGYTCQLSNKGLNVCCQSYTPFSNMRLAPSSLVKCSNGVIPPREMRDCQTNGDCPRGSFCSKSSGASVCCADQVPIDTRCLARRTLLSSGAPVECLMGSTCETDYECSHDTTNGRAVCCETPEKAQEICPENRVAFIVARTEEVMYCDATAYVCPNGQECVRSRDGSRHVCCSPPPQCPPGSLTPSKSIHPQRCFSADGCSQGLACIPSTLDDVKVCCNVVYSDQPIKEEEDEWVVIEG